MFKLIIIFAFIFFDTGCNIVVSPKIIITKEYIINKYWDQYNTNMYIEKLKLKDSTNLLKSNTELIRKDFRYLEVDSTFRYEYFGNSPDVNPKSYPYQLHDKKLYFNQDNGGYWYFDNYSGSKHKVIGNLENNTWYKLSNLKGIGGFFVYVYVDSTGTVHKYIQDLAGPF